MNEATPSVSRRFRRALGWIALGALGWNLILAPVLIFALEATGREAPGFEPMRIQDLLAIATVVLGE